MFPLKVLNASNCNSIISKATSQRIMKYEMRLQHTTQMRKHQTAVAMTPLLLKSIL